MSLLIYLTLGLMLWAGHTFAQCWRNVTCTGPSTAAFPGAWDENIYAPASRTIPPKFVLSWPGLLQQPYGSEVYLEGNGSLVTYDFGIEVGGILSFDYSSLGSGSIGIAFTESKDFVGEWSDASNGAFRGPDGALYTNLTGASTNRTYVMPEEKLRGGFRYLTLFLTTNSSARASIGQVNVELDFQPTWANMRAYQGYFHSSDELLNRIWYAGAYTIQSNCVPTNTGRQVPFLRIGWANNATLGMIAGTQSRTFLISNRSRRNYHSGRGQTRQSRMARRYGNCSAIELLQRRGPRQCQECSSSHVRHTESNRCIC